MLQNLSKFWVWDINSLENSIVQGSCLLVIVFCHLVSWIWCFMINGKLKYFSGVIVMISHWNMSELYWLVWHWLRWYGKDYMRTELVFLCRYQWFLEVIVCMPSDWHISYRNANAVKPCCYLELFGDCENTYNIWGHEVKNLKEKAVETSKWLWHIHGIWDTLYWWSRNWNSSVYFCFPCPNQCKHQFSLSVHVPHCINLYRGLQ